MVRYLHHWNWKSLQIKTLVFRRLVITFTSIPLDLGCFSQLEFLHISFLWTFVTRFCSESSREQQVRNDHVTWVTDHYPQCLFKVCFHMKGCSWEVPYWHSGQATIWGQQVSVVPALPVVYTKQEGLEEDKTSKGMKKMGLKFDLSVAWLVMSDKGRWWNLPMLFHLSFNMTPQWKKRLPCGNWDQKIGSYSTSGHWLRVWPGKRHQLPHRGPAPPTDSNHVC